MLYMFIRMKRIKQRKKHADEGVERLRKYVEALVVIPNERLLQIVPPKTPIQESFRFADDVLRQGVQGISDLIVFPGLINLDFADVCTIMKDKGLAHMGIGYGTGDNKALEAVKQAVASPLLDTTIEGATGILINIKGQPTYFMSLKDSGNIVKRYAMVNVQNYQVAVTGNTIAECTEAYAEKLKQNNINIKIDIDEIIDATEGTEATEDGAVVDYETVKGTVTDIRTAVMSGESVYFIELDGKGVYYTIAASDAENVVIMNKGDKISVKFRASEDKIIEAVAVK